MPISAAVAIKIVFITGITNLIGLLLVLASCRCIMTRYAAWLAASTGYRRFYGYHCYYWYFFIASVIVHISFAMAVIGIPFF